MSEYAYTVRDIEPLTTNIVCITMVPLAVQLPYQPGQYVMFNVPGLEPQPCSIASHPDAGDLSFHLRQGPAFPLTHALIHAKAAGQTVPLSAGMGRWAPQARKRTILLAGGVGITPFFSLIPHQAAEGPTVLYWGVKAPDDFYHVAQLEAWAAQYPNFSYVLVSETSADWQGRTGLVHEAVLADNERLSDAQCFASGPYAMAHIAHETFTSRDIAYFYSDMLD